MVIKFVTRDGLKEIDVCKVARIYHNGGELVVALITGEEFTTWEVHFESVWG